MILITKPKLVMKSSNLVIRGGGWRYNGRFHRLAFRGGIRPIDREIFLGGFRIVLRRRVK